LPAAGASSDRAVAGEVIYGGGPIRRHFPTEIVLRRGNDVIVNRPDGSQVIYSGRAGLEEARRDGLAV
jgi:hypothetical protein